MGTEAEGLPGKDKTSSAEVYLHTGGQGVLINRTAILALEESTNGSHLYIYCPAKVHIVFPGATESPRKQKTSLINPESATRTELDLKRSHGKFYIRDLGFNFVPDGSDGGKVQIKRNTGGIEKELIDGPDFKKTLNWARLTRGRRRSRSHVQNSKRP